VQTLKTAVTKIYQIVDQRRKRKPPLPSPFFFIAGAGISNPPIPLAWEIEQHCRQEATSYDDTIPPELKSTMDSYSHWMGKAYPSPEELQTYLRGLMENKPISKANLRMAHLLLDGRLARTVFTPNFDDMLAKALELFGQRPLVCDHPLTGSRIRIESGDTQIVHVHGSYWFYDCCNLRPEIADRSNYGPMSVLLDQSLRDHSPIVIGYSGWEGDILMSAFQRRLAAGKLGTPAFWFCYKRESVDALPAWLRESNDIYFVLPEDPSPTTASVSAAEPTEPKSRASVLSGSKSGIRDSSSDAKVHTLPANKVLDALVRRFQPRTPPLTQNPLSFYADHLRGLLGASDPEGELDTYYSFHTVIARVERARDSEAAEEPALLQEFRDAMSKANYRGAIQSAKEIDLGRLSGKERTELLFALMDASLGLNDNSHEEMAGYDLVISLADLLRSSGLADLRQEEQVAEALVNKGIVLGTLNRSEEAIAAYDDVVSRFADAKEPALREQTARALFNKGVTLGNLARSEEEIAVYDDVVSRFADEEEPAIREQVAMALFNKGFALGTLNRSEEAIAVYDDVVNRFADAKEPALLELVAKALLNKGVRLGSLNRSEEAIAVYDDVVSRFADAKELAIRERVAKALLNKGVALGTLNRSEEAIAVYDDVVSRFADAKEPALREQVANALFNKGVTLGNLGRSEEEIAVYDGVVGRFADARDLGLRELVANVLVNKGVRLGALNRSEEEIAVYDDVVSRFADEEELAIRERVAKAILYRGLTYESSGKKEIALADYEQVLTRFATDKGPEIEALVSQAKERLANLRDGDQGPSK